MATMDKLDISLEDLIKAKPKAKPKPKPKPKTTGAAGKRKGKSGGVVAKPALKAVASGGVGKKGGKSPLPAKTIRNDPKGGRKPAFVDKGGSGIVTGTRLDILNLDYGVTAEDLRMIFEDVGELKKTVINFDKVTGRSMGNGFVIFRDRRRAEAAKRKFEGERLDGRPMQIRLATQGGASSSSAVMPRGRSSHTVTYTDGRGHSVQVTGGVAGAVKSSGKRGPRGGRRRGGAPPSADALDKQMDTHMRG